jgi:hypothetical protein
MKSLFSYFLFSIGCLCGWMGVAHAQNRAFSEAGDSEVEYWLTPYESKAACADLKALSNSGFTIDSSEEKMVDGTDIEFCKIDGVIPPEIQFQVNLPVHWNGRIYMHGNGGNAGMSPDHPRRWGTSINAIKQGFAVIYSNGGHDADEEPGVSFAVNNPGKVLDYGFRATQLSALAGKQIADVYYKRESDHDYFDGCSWGGHQGFAMAQRFPDLFDGILAGSPVFNFTAEHFGLRALFGALYPDWPKQADTDAVAAAILAKCDALDGLEDGVVMNPRACSFNPAVDLPNCDDSSEGDYCISDEMRKKLASIYQPVIAGNQVLAPGRPVGSEFRGYQRAASRSPEGFVMKDGWSVSLVPVSAEEVPFMLGRVQDAVNVYLYEEVDMDRSWMELDIERDWKSVKQHAQHMDETDPDLRPLRARGGKLLAYHGWGDFNINPNLTYEYFEKVHEEMGEQAANDTTRLFMVPGMFHCGGGSDVFVFDGMTPLINWVERGEAPEEIIFSGNTDYHLERKRPVCAFPAAARYVGGDPELPGSFECVLENR